MLRRLTPYLLLALFALPALWPFFQAGLPRTNDNLPHYYRVVELDQLIRAGVLFPRWASDLGLGYGYPVFNFFPYLSHYLAELFHLLGLNFLNAFKAAYVTSLLGAIWLAYRLGREYFGEAAGLITGVAYLYSPYLLYDTHVRGSLPEVLALALLPLAMLHLRRAAHGQRPAVVWAGLALAAMLLAHNGVSLQALPFLGLYSLWQYAIRNTSSQNKLELSDLRFGFWDLGFCISPFLLALLLSAFFWLPALAEARYIQIERGTLNGAMNYANHFFSLPELLALPRLPVDPALLNPPVVHALPQVAIVISFIGGVLLVIGNWRISNGRIGALGFYFWDLGFFLLLISLATFLITPPAKPLWDNLPLLKLTLFPWRLLGPISLWCALLTGAFFTLHFSNHPFGNWFLGFGICLVIFAGLPLASPPFETFTAAPTRADLAAIEIPPDFIGTTTVGEYLPVWVKQLPADLTENRARLINGEPIQKFDPLPSPVVVLPTGEGPGVRSDSFTLDSPHVLTFTYRTFYFPGWRATLDGSPAPITITYPDGLMSVAVPAGKHTLTFEFGTTWPRVLGWALTITGLGACIGFLVIGKWELWNVALKSETHISKLPFGFWLLGFGILFFRPLLYDPGLTPLLRRQLTTAGLTGVAHPLNTDFAGELTLLGWDASHETFTADETTTLNLYWKAKHPLGVAYGFQARLVDEQGLTWSERDTPRPRDWRFTPGTDFWPDDQYILDSYQLTPRAGTPPGAYWVEVNVFAYYNLQSIGTTRIGPINIAQAARARTCAEGAGPYNLSQVIALTTVSFDRDEAAPGDEILLTACWQARQTPDFDWSAQLALKDATGAMVFSHTLDLVPGFPTSQWHAGDSVLGQWPMRLPATLTTGDYTWHITVGEMGVSDWAVHITAPERVFTAPPVERVLNENLGPVTLFGVNLPPAGVGPGTTATVTLVWAGNQTPASAYHVFVHLQNSEGVIVAQSDGAPADWTRPTTGWLPGEFVSETRALTLPPDLPPGAYTVFAGMYAPKTGERLTNPAFPDGRVALGGLTIAPAP